MIWEILICQCLEENHLMTSIWIVYQVKNFACQFIVYKKLNWKKFILLHTHKWVLSTIYRNYVQSICTANIRVYLTPGFCAIWYLVHHTMYQQVECLLGQHKIVNIISVSWPDLLFVPDFTLWHTSPMRVLRMIPALLCHRSGVLWMWPFRYSVLHIDVPLLCILICCVAGIHGGCG